MRATATTNDKPSFDRSSWLTIAGVALLTACWIAIFVFAVRQPTDGCVIQQGTDNVQIIQGCVGNWSTTLRPGDQILEVDGQSLRLDLTSSFPPQAPSDWVEGASVSYLVQRDGATHTLTVPLERFGWSDIIRLLSFDMANLLTNVATLVVAATAFVLRPNSRATQLLLISQGAGAIGQILAVPSGLISQVAWNYWPTPLLTSVATVLALATSWLVQPALLLLLLSFPRRVWPLARWPIVTTVVMFGLGIASTALTILTGSFLPFLVSLGLYTLLIVVTFLATITGTALHVRNPVVRAQAMWLGLGFVIYSSQVFLWLATLAYPPLGTWLQINIIPRNVLSMISTLAIPVCLTIAILRHRLFDIEIIIRRTLVYSLLTLTLGATYLIGVVALQALFVRFTGQESALAVVASTLAIAALFGPLRRRVQHAIDRRFFRKKYDAQHVLEQFALRVQQQADINTLAADIVHVVNETVQPERAQVWLARTDRRDASS